jgi:hypothetical protein
VKSTRFRDGEPYVDSGRRGDEVREWLSLTPPILALVGVTAGFWLLWQALSTPVPASVSISPPNSARDSFVPPPASTFPPQLVVMAVAVSTFLAPMNEPTPTPRPTSVPTPVLIAMICGPGVVEGTTCQWKLEPTPTQPPLPICQTPMPGSECIWHGNLTGTPTTIETVIAGGN